MAYDLGVDETRSPLLSRGPAEFDRRLPRLIQAIVTMVLAMEVTISVALEFGVHLPLWLDEALTVNISSLPVAQIPGALKHDGAPPLFYVILHVWMGFVGHSDVAVRSLAGVFALGALVMTAVTVRAIWSTRVAVVTVALLAGSPYFVYYGSECRMYSLVMFESIVLLYALHRASETPSRGRLILVAASVAALLYTHYWSLYLVGVLGLWLLARAAFGPQSWRGTAWRIIAAVLGGCVAFIPWVPVFFYQAAHTGTPWSAPTQPSIVVELFGWLTYNQAALFQVDSLHSQILLVSYLGFAVIGIVAVATGRFTGALDLRVQGRARLMAVWAIGTVAVGSALSVLSSSAVTPRYAAVAFIPFMILLALGITSFGDPWVRVGLAFGVAFMGLWAAKEYRTTARTESPAVASALNSAARAGDVVLFCPDQLAPSTLRLLNTPGIVTMGYPNLSVANGRIDWVDYEKKISRRPPVVAAKAAEALAGPTHTVWLVSQTYAPGLHGRCDDLAQQLALDRGITEITPVVAADIHRYYQPMQLLSFPPRGRNHG